MKRKRWTRAASAAFAAVLGMLFGAAGLEGRITRIVIEQRESPAFNGQAFGKAGTYETLRGHFYGEIDPKDPHNAISPSTNAPSPSSASRLGR